MGFLMQRTRHCATTGGAKPTYRLHFYFHRLKLLCWARFELFHNINTLTSFSFQTAAKVHCFQVLLDIKRHQQHEQGEFPSFTKLSICIPNYLFKENLFPLQSYTLGTKSMWLFPPTCRPTFNSDNNYRLRSSPLQLPISNSRSHQYFWSTGNQLRNLQPCPQVQ